MGKIEKIYRIGSLDVDLPFCLRIPKGFNSEGLISKHEVESYCINASNLWDGGERNLTSFVLPVKYNNKGELSYALLVEDLTNWGVNVFEGDNISGEFKLKLKLKSGEIKEYYVDLGPRSYQSYSFYGIGDYKFTKNAIDLTK